MRAYAKMALWGLALLLVAAPACKPRSQEKPLPPVVRPVVVVKLQAPATRRELSFSGVARAAVETRLSFRVGGTIDSLRAKVGMRVKAGEVIARLDPTDYRLKVKQLMAELARVQAGLKAAKSDYRRVRELYEVGSSSAGDLDRARAAYESKLAAYEATQRHLELARRQLEYCVLRAPMAGSIAAVPVEVHQSVAPGTPVAVLTSDQQLEVEIGVPEGVIGRLKVGELAQVTFDALPGVRFQAVVSEVGVETGRSTAYPVKLRLLKQDPRVRSGMVGEVSFFLPPRPGDRFILVPPVALAGSAGGERFVWVVDPKTSTVHKREVTTGDFTSRGLQIKSGLKPGELVVIRGVHRLQEGQKVRVIPREQWLKGRRA